MARLSTIEIRSLTKRFGSVDAVSDLTFDVAAGRVTGFLGPNGAGKTTTLRMLLGLVRPSSGSATFGGTAYEALDDPARRVGAVLEDTGFHPGRRGRDHLRVLAAAAGLPASRVDEVLEVVGLQEVGSRRVKGYSLGMRQRLAIGSALLGDPDVLVLDEPTNGLDPAGVRWLRSLMRAMASQGKAVLVSSHLLAEVAQTVDEAVVIAEGRLRAAGPIDELMSGTEGGTTRVRSVDDARLAEALERGGMRVARDGGDGLVVHGAAPEVVGPAAFAAGVALTGLTAEARSLEDVFLGLVEGGDGPVAAR